MAIKNQLNNNHQLIFNEVKERLRDEMESISSLDTKAGITLAFVGAFLGGLVNSRWFISLKFYFLLPVLVGLVLTTLFSLLAILAGDYSKDPEPSSLIEGYSDKKEEETIAQLIRNFEDSFNKNKKKILKKKKRLNTALAFLFISILLLSIAVFFSTNKIIIQPLR